MEKKILILAPNPTDTNKLSLDEEVKKIEAAAENKTEIEIISKWAVSADKLQNLLRRYKPKIVHFCGHGKGDDGLVLENESGQMQLVPGKALAELFEFNKDYVDCVVMNACYSEVQAKAIHQHINCVIGMNNSIGDKAAIIFATGFYNALFDGDTYERSFKFGRNNIDLENIPESQTPQINIRDTSKGLLDPDSRNKNEFNTPKKLRNLFTENETDEYIDMAADMFSKMKYIINKYEITIENIYKTYEYNFARLSRNIDESLWKGQEKIKKSNERNRLLAEISKQLKEHSEENKNKFLELLENTGKQQKQPSNNKSFEIKNKTKSLQSLHSYLLIQLRPKGNSQLSLKAWFIPDDTIQDPWERFKPLTVDELKTEIPFVPEELPQLLGNLLGQCFEEYLQGQPTELSIEIFLPRDRLWHEEVEKWKYLDLKYLDSGNTKKKLPSVAIGIRHRVVIRSYDRMRKQSKQKDSYWNKKWRKLDWEDSCVNLIKKFPQDYSDLDKVRVLLGGRISECEELITLCGDTIFLKMSCNLSKSEKNILLDFIESEGIPILIWSRCDLQSVKNSTDFDELMQTKLHELPNHVKKQRVSAQREHLIAKKQALEVDSSNHLGNHLVLLWDDPNRVPPNPALE